MLPSHRIGFTLHQYPIFFFENSSNLSHIFKRFQNYFPPFWAEVVGGVVWSLSFSRRFNFKSRGDVYDIQISSTDTNITICINNDIYIYIIMERYCHIGCYVLPAHDVGFFATYPTKITRLVMIPEVGVANFAMNSTEWQNGWSHPKAAYKNNIL